MKITLLTHTPEPVKTIYIACRTCYSKTPPSEMGDVPQEKMTKLIRHTMESGHHSVLEHVTFSFAVEGVSRALTHQLVRHRLASYAQQSQRYVTYEEGTLNFVTPKSIEATALKTYNAFMAESARVYEELVASGVPAEDARYVLPNATVTQIVVTMNYRELIQFCRLRLCFRAQWEITEMTHLMKKEMIKVSRFLGNYLQPKCQHLGYCDETEPCGKYQFPPESSVVKAHRKELEL